MYRPEQTTSLIWLTPLPPEWLLGNGLKKTCSWSKRRFIAWFLYNATGNTADPLYFELLRYNQFVLEPSPERFHSTCAAVHCPQISALLTAVGYAYGIVNELPMIESLG